MKKVVNQKQSEIFEKVVFKNGRQFLVRFVVIERGGKLRGKVLSCEAIEALVGTSEQSEVTCLPSVSFFDKAPLSRNLFEEIVSPYFSLDFLTSIQIRAPSQAHN